jgi:AraC-like DNA-binding protein
MLLPDLSQTRLRDAVAQKRRGGFAGGATARDLGSGRGWRVLEVMCTAGEADAAFEERHGGISLSLVLEGSFQYRSDHGRALMTPGSVLLGNVGACFQCGHEHGEGDLCLSFQFDPDLVGEIAGELGLRFRGFAAPRLSQHRALARFFAYSSDLSDATTLEVASLDLMVQVLSLVMDSGAPAHISDRDTARVTEVVRHLEENFAEPVSIDEQAALAGLSRFHFLRTFRRALDVTPHQYLLRRRLRSAAERLVTTDDPVTAICFDAGFGDLSNFNRTFRCEFQTTPREFRRRRGRAGRAACPNTFSRS